MGASVFDQNGQIFTGVTFTCPATRFGPHAEARIVAQVRQTAQDISRELGYHKP